MEPLKNGFRPYALLRKVLKKTGKVGIAKVVIRTRQHLAMLFADGPRLILNLLRFPADLRDAARLDLPKGGARSAAVTSQEINMAERLIETMVSEWQPEKYHDEYRDDLMKIIDKKIISAIEPHANIEIASTSQQTIARSNSLASFPSGSPVVMSTSSSKWATSLKQMQKWMRL